jgi:hypothetical protein
MSRAQVGPDFGGPNLLCLDSFLASTSYSFIIAAIYLWAVSPFLMRAWAITEV